MALPRGIRNNNPGNIRVSPTAWRGEVAGADPAFETFETPEMGIRAMGRLLRTYRDKHGLNTIQGIVSRYAPASENDVGSYVASVARRTGLDPTAPIDLDRDGARLVEAMIAHENGKQPYTPDQIAKGLQMAGYQVAQAETGTMTDVRPVSDPSIVRELESLRGAPRPVTDDALIKALEQVRQQQSPGIISRIGTAIMGDPNATDVPELYGQTVPGVRAIRGQGQDARMTQLGARLQIARDPVEQQRAIQEVYPQAEFVEDQAGQVLVRLEPGGDVFAVNKSGLSMQDVTPLAVEGMAAIGLANPAMRAGGALVGQGAGRIAGAATAAGGASLTMDAGNMAAGQSDSFNLGRATLAGLMGTAGEGLAMAIEGLAPAAKAALARAFSSDPIMQGGTLTPRVRDALRVAGIDPDEITPDAMNALRATFRPNADVAAQARMAEGRTLPEPVNLTAGQATQNPATAMMETQAKKGAFGVDVAEQARLTELAQTDALSSNIERMRTAMGGKDRSGAIRTAEALRFMDAAKRSSVNRAYNLARDGDEVYIDRAAIVDLGKTMRADIRSSFDLGAMPRTSRLIDMVEKPPGAGGKVKGYSLRAMEQWRTRAVNARTAAFTSGASDEAAAIKRLIDAYDGQIDDMMTNALLKGDKDQIELWKAARTQRREYGRMFGENDIINKLVAKEKDGSGNFVVPVDEAANYIFGRGDVGARAGLVKDLVKLKKMLPEQEWNELRAEAFVRLFRDRDGTINITQANLNEVGRLLGEHGYIANKLFNDQERRTLAQLMRVGRSVIVPPRIKGDMNPSGTAAAAAVTQRVASMFGVAGRVLAGAGQVIGQAGSNAAKAQEVRLALEGILKTIDPMRAPGVGAAGAPFITETIRSATQPQVTPR